MLICGHLMLFTPFFKDEICALCAETFYSFNIWFTVINSYPFTADLILHKNLYMVWHFACHCQLSSHLTWQWRKANFIDVVWKQLSADQCTKLPIITLSSNVSETAGIHSVILSCPSLRHKFILHIISLSLVYHLVAIVY
jgi:hypothetical protein